METFDATTGQGYELSEIFAHAPSEFEFFPPKLTWESPCWLEANLILRPQSDMVGQKFLFNLKIPNRWDAFAKTSWAEQLWKTFGPVYCCINGTHQNEWRQELWHCYELLKALLNQTEGLFPGPFRFIGRNEFQTSDLATVLREDPKTLSIYLAFEKRTYCEYSFLRIHSSLPVVGSQRKRVWFEKRLPDCLHLEDVVPWFNATIQRLPKKSRPADLEPWTKRFLEFEPQLALPDGGADKPWSEKPKLVFVLGPTPKVGYRNVTHFERRDIDRVVRRDEVIRIEGKERFSFNDGKTMEFERTFFLFAFDESAAERVERRMLSGERIHFGLDSEVLGMICHSAQWVHAINVPLESVRRLCLKPGLDLRLVSNPRDKLKTYQLFKPDFATPSSKDEV